MKFKLLLMTYQMRKVVKMLKKLWNKKGFTTYEYEREEPKSFEEAMSTEDYME